MSQEIWTWTTNGNITFANTYDRTGDTTVDSPYITSIDLAESAIGALWTAPNPITLTLHFVSDTSGNTKIASNEAYSFIPVRYSDLGSKLPSWDTLPPDPTSGGFFYLPESYARMLGLSTTPPAGAFDATIKLNTAFRGLDEVVAIEHEITEGAMGRIGGLGKLVFERVNVVEQIPLWGVPDLFRYGSNGVYDKQAEHTAYFSDNGGSTTSYSTTPRLAFFAGNSIDDTADFDAFDVFGFNGTYTFSQTDKEIMDALGWEPILPELEITTNSLRPLSATVHIGDTISLSATVTNYGATPAGAFKTQFYLSTKATFDSSAIAIGDPISTTSLAAGATITLNEMAKVPSIAAGTDYLFAVPDYLNQITQLNSNNVSHSIPIKVVPNVINTLADLEAVRNDLSGHYILGANIDATGLNIAPIGSTTNPFTGTFDGNGHTINGLHIVGNGIYVGLFAEVGAGGKISNLGLTNLSVSAPRGYDVGGLAGRNLGTIENSYTTGTISGTAGNFVAGLNGIAIGGVAGWNFGTIKDSYSSASITSASTIFVDLGGLAGGNSGLIDHSHANGAIIGHSGAYGSGLVEIGGLVGSLGFATAGGTILHSYATGSVISDGSNTAAGGLVGTSVSSSTIFQSYATGSVITGGPSWDGGLVGILFNGTISQSFAKGSVTVGNGGDAGGFVGQMNAGTIFESYAKGAATGASSTDVGGLVAHSYGGFISQSYATGKITGGSFSIKGGLAAENHAVTASSYWDSQSTGQMTSSGGTPLSSLFLRLGILPVGFDPAVWSENILSAGGYPYLRSIPFSSVIGGKLAGAIVFADDNGNGTLDPDESLAISDDQGSFEPIGGTGPLIAYGGTDTFTGLSFKGILEATSGSTKISPLSTLVTSLQNEGVSNAEAQVLTALSINPAVDITTFDPITELLVNNADAAQIYSKNAEIMNSVAAITSALTNTGPIAQNSVQVFDALAAIINNHGSAPVDLSDPTLVAQILTAAALALNATIDPEIVSTAAAVLAASNSIIERDASRLIGQDLLDAVSDVERLGQGALSDALQKAAADPSLVDAIVNAFTGSNLDNALAPQSSGANHAPWLATDKAAFHAIAEIAGTTGSNVLDTANGKLLFTDQDVADTHYVSAALDPSSPTWMAPDGTVFATALLPKDTYDTLVHALQATLVSDSTNGAIGEISWNFAGADHFFDFLGTGESLRATYNIAVTDNQGSTGLEPVTVLINSSNDSPLAVPDSNGIAKGSVLSVSALAGLLANDSDPDVHDHLTVSGVGGNAASVGHAISGTYGSLTLNADGSYLYSANKGALPAQFVAQDTFAYSISDGHGGTASSTLSIVVSNPGVAYQSGTNTSLKGFADTKNVLDGSGGNDVLTGNNDKDVLIGGNGDVLTGGTGPDTFVFRPAFGTNTITDFNVINDVLQFDKSIFSSAVDLLAHTTNTISGAAINDGHGDTVTLSGVTLVQLQAHQNDFHFV
ncbi:VCBS repeat-containing protein [Bradyrhizobium sp. USDA 4501]